jgi:hypothetical protein
LVTEAIDVVVHQQRIDGRPVVTEISCVEDLAGGEHATQFTVTTVFDRPSTDAPLAWTGAIPSRLRRAFERAGIDLVDVLDPSRGTGTLPALAERRS